MSLVAAHAAVRSADLVSVPDMPEGYSLHGCAGHYYWTRGQLTGPLGWGSSARETAEACAADARAHAAAHPLKIERVERTPEVEALIRALLSGRRLDLDEAALLGLLAIAPRYSLRYAAASSGLGCGPGCARQAAWSLSVLGAAVDRVELARVWLRAHEALDPQGAWACPDELRANTRDALEYEQAERWRRATVDAFDAVRRRGLSQDDQACAWSRHVSARYYALHLLGVRLDEVEDLQATVRAWLPARYRAPAA